MRDNNQETYKQTFWFIIINYVGILVGVFSTLFIYPNDKNFLGIVRYVDSVSQLLFPIMIFGTAQALIHFSPSVSTTNKNLLFKYGILTILAISILVSVIIVAGWFIIDYKNYKYILLALPLAIMLAYVEFFKRQATNIQKLAIPTLYEKIIPKIAFPFVFVLLLFGHLNIIQSIIGYLFSYLLLTLFLAFYLFKNMKFKFTINFKPLFSEVSKKSYYNYSFFAFAGSFGSFFAFRLDALMIPEFINFEASGTYTIGVTLASAIAIPATGLFAIYGPIVSNYLKENDIKSLGNKYRETSKLLFFIGSIFFGSVILGIDSLFQLMPTYDKLVDAIPVIFILGANVLINMATGFNTEIISYSEFYKFNLKAIFLLVVLNISLNFFFLTQTNLGIEGVAYASLIAMTLFNILKLQFIYLKFKILPFDKSFLKLFLVLAFLVCFIYFLPLQEIAMLNLVFKVGLFILATLLIVYKFKLVYSLNEWTDKLIYFLFKNDK
jgi:O-antigen/teichoic acid export membrane protein